MTVEGSHRHRGAVRRTCATAVLTAVLTFVVSVPAAGKLVATGKGLSRATGNAGGAGTVTVKMTLSSNEQAFLAKHKGRRLKVAVKLLFTPKHGGKLSGSVTVLIG